MTAVTVPGFALIGQTRARVRTRFRASAAALAVGVSSLAMAIYTTALSVRTSPFQDEGLYIYMGHRMAQHLFHGDTIIEHPSAYLSGSPMIYPPLAAMADTLGGLAGARALSLLFILVAGLFVYLFASGLFGRFAGVIANVAFLFNGSVLYQAHLATFDAMVCALVAAAVFLVVRSSRRDALTYGFAIAPLLGLAFLTKYMAAVYISVVAVLAVAVGWSTWRWRVVRQSLVMVLIVVAAVYAYIELFAREIWLGITSTTFDRNSMSPASDGHMLASLFLWAGPWVVAAILATIVNSIGPRGRDLLAVRLVLLGGTLAAPLGQMRIHEMTSFSKHLAFGMIFAAPLVGELVARLLRATRGKAMPTAAAFLALVLVLGVSTSRTFLTGWIDNGPLLGPLTQAIDRSPGKAILAEVGSGDRYSLRKETTPGQWADVYSFSYAGLSGLPAFERAIDQSHFGVIYLSLTTVNGKAIHEYLTTHPTPYILGPKPPRYLRGELVGSWLVFVPRVTVT